MSPSLLMAIRRDWPSASGSSTSVVRLPPIRQMNPWIVSVPPDAVEVDADNGVVVVHADCDGLRRTGDRDRVEGTARELEEAVDGADAAV